LVPNCYNYYTEHPGIANSTLRDERVGAGFEER
jgi:hypothetical protein